MTLLHLAWPSFLTPRDLLSQAEGLPYFAMKRCCAFVSPLFVSEPHILLYIYLPSKFQLLLKEFLLFFGGEGDSFFKRFFFRRNRSWNEGSLLDGAQIAGRDKCKRVEVSKVSWSSSKFTNIDVLKSAIAGFDPQSPQGWSQCANEEAPRQEESSFDLLLKVVGLTL